MNEEPLCLVIHPFDWEPISDADKANIRKLFARVHVVDPAIPPNGKVYILRDADVPWSLR